MATQWRRVSEMPSNAPFPIHYPPRKQQSTPLPEVEKHRIYERGHVISRSWNLERYDYEQTPPDGDSDGNAPTQNDRSVDPYKKFYQDMMRVFGSDPRVTELAEGSVAAAVAANVVNTRPSARQTKSFDDRGGERRIVRNVAKRSLTEAEKWKLVRQETVSHLAPQDQISKECLNLWADRKLLESGSRFGNQVSTDMSSEQSASTSFESNTEPVHAEGPVEERRNSSFLELPTSAFVKRQKFKSVLSSRSSSAVQNEGASSFESAISTSESSAANSLAANRETASFDSTLSDQIDHDKPREEARRQQPSTSSVSPRRPPIGPPRVSGSVTPYSPLARRAIGQHMTSSLLQRDYSVDSKTDRLFREFVRVDPRFERVPSVPSRSSFTSRHNVAVARQRTINIPDVDPYNTVHVLPPVCFAGEQTLTR